MMSGDEEYGAELRARTPEQWATMAEKALADEKDIIALQHLMWRGDVMNWQGIVDLAKKPDMSLEDRDFALRQVGEIADKLRAARDNPEKRERRRWQNVMFCAAMVAPSEDKLARVWIKETLNSFPAGERGPTPDDDASPLVQATYAVECLLDALLSSPEERAELNKKMNGAFMRWCGENGIRSVSFPRTPYDEALREQKQGHTKRDGARINAIGQGEMFGAEIVPLNSSNGSSTEPPPPTGPSAA
jgi:hypothetical protein